MSASWVPSADPAVCAGYHGGQGSMMYALVSCGCLETGSERFRGGRDDAEWLRDLLVSLEWELAAAIVLARKHGEEWDAGALGDLLMEVGAYLLYTAA